MTRSDPPDAFSLTLADFESFDMDSPPFLFPGIYALLEDEEVIYVGQSGDIPRRLKEHKRERRWFAKVTEVRVLWCSDPEHRLVCETVQILRERPRHNRAIKIGLSASSQFYSIAWLPSNPKFTKGQ